MRVVAAVAALTLLGPIVGSVDWKSHHGLCIVDGNGAETNAEFGVPRRIGRQDVPVVNPAPYIQKPLFGGGSSKILKWNDEWRRVNFSTCPKESPLDTASAVRIGEIIRQLAGQTGEVRRNGGVTRWRLTAILPLELEEAVRPWIRAVKLGHGRAGEVNERSINRRVPILAPLGEASGFEPKEDCGKGQHAREDCHPRIWRKPEYASLGGLLLGSGCNLLGGWLYLYDKRRPRLTNRRAIGGALILLGWLTVASGYYWAALNGGGY